MALDCEYEDSVIKKKQIESDDNIFFILNNLWLIIANIIKYTKGVGNKIIESEMSEKD